MRSRRGSIRLALLLAFGLAAAACSDGPPTSTPSSASPPTVSPTPNTTEPPAASWRPLPEAPIAGRIGAGVVWTGEEMIVWGGISRAKDIEAAADGAAYDPAADSWRTIAPAPRGVLGDVGTAAAWTGTTAVFWAGNSPDGPAVGGVYDPSTDAWRRLPGGPLGPREGYTSVWTGTELLIVGGTSGDGFAQPVAAALDPRTGSWRLLPGLNEFVALRPTGAVWTGDQVFLAGARFLCPEEGSSCADVTPVFIAYDPTTDRVDEIDLVGAPLDEPSGSSFAPVGWFDERVVLSTSNGASARLVFYEPGTARWDIGAAPPCAAADDGYEQAAWLGDRFVVPCGRVRIQLYDVASDAWTILAAGRSPLNTRLGSAIAWSGSDLIAWSGTVYREGNPTPNDGDAIRLLS